MKEFFAITMVVYVFILFFVCRIIEMCKRHHSVCTRPYPHVCRVNGPCNGWPKG